MERSRTDQRRAGKITFAAVGTVLLGWIGIEVVRHKWKGIGSSRGQLVGAGLFAGFAFLGVPTFLSWARKKRDGDHVQRYLNEMTEKRVDKHITR